jgi:hypothetical protein
MSTIVSGVLLGIGISVIPLGQGAMAMSMPAADHRTSPDRPPGAEVLVQYRRPVGFNANGFRGNVTANRNVNINSNRTVNVNRNVNVTNYGGNYGPNWGGVAAGVAVGAGIGIAATAAASAAATAYPPPPPYPYYYPPPPY